MRRILIFAVALVVLVGCAPTGEPAAGAVESYLKALVEEDADRISVHSCGEWEEQALLELDAFIGVSASLSDMSCRQIDSEDGSALVECEGTIQATYNNEQQTFELSGRTYRVVQESGDWRVCGYR